MTEKLLQFIWKHRYFNQQSLELVTGERLMIEYPGDENTDQGPDFSNARISINGNYWIGSVELHLFSSGWEKHSHSDDLNYKNVILHVVWKRDHLEMNRHLPELELYERIPRIMLDTYSNWMKKPTFVPCELSARKMENRKWEAWSSALLIRRLNRKMKDIQHSLHQHHYHWEQQLWWMIAANFGNPVNTNAFESIGKSIPFTLIGKHREQFIQLEALLIGQANLLQPVFNDPYAVLLQREYHFLKKKYSLKEIYEPVHFLRMRPENFPGIRLSQLAALYSKNNSLFAWSLTCETAIELRRKLMVQANDYWHNHYVFEKISPFREKILGFNMINNIIINSFIPLLYTYGKTIPDQQVLEKSMVWLTQIPAEENKLLSSWRRIGISVNKAAGSQALIELKKHFCDQRKCLDCDIGKMLLNPTIKPEN